MSSYKILGISDTSEWNTYLNSMPIEFLDVYFKPEYYNLYEHRGDGRAQCFVYENSGSIVLYPFLLNSVNKLGYELEEEYYDIQGAYGYNGIITNNGSNNFLTKFFTQFDIFCKENNIIAEFLRINPLLSNPLVQRPNFLLIHDRENIYLNLLSDSIFETDFAYSTRKNIRKAINNGLIFECVNGSAISDTQLHSFHEIYRDTMKRNNADAYYYFDTDFFRKISQQLKDKALFVFVSYAGVNISCELVLLGSSIAYSFLGGTLNNYYQLRPNDFLKYNTINALKKLGYKYFLLGGGPEGVLRYKKTFSINGSIPFYIGKKVHFPDLYDNIINQWQSKYPDKIDNYRSILLKYRY
ncbi:MAG: hypothetical protein CVU13_10115 [Bacteroidetes bacterium HGW-Bacteroidetes-8]|jgi:hypothetical protein|nr:MAG: hypothetical protein CVU13_10115 [Bacteroidetes bacterium HGW-Bacteroidetes-8]